MNRPPRLSRRSARRLLDGRPAARPREARLAEFLDTLADRDAAAPAAALDAAPDVARDAAPDLGAQGAAGDAVPAALLEAFAREAAEAGPVRPRAARSGARSASGPAARSRRIGRALTVKAAVVLALSGATVAAAAAADALPAPAQRAAHELLGSWGVPAPGSRDPGTPERPGLASSRAVPGGTGPTAPAADGRYAHVPDAGAASSGTACAGDGWDGWDDRTRTAPADRGTGTAGRGEGYGYSDHGAGTRLDRACSDGTDGADGLPGAAGLAGGALPGPLPSVPAAGAGGTASGLRSTLAPGRGRSRLPRPTGGRDAQD